MKIWKVTRDMDYNGCNQGFFIKKSNVVEVAIIHKII
jgi:hypothetical protein